MKRILATLLAAVVMFSAFPLAAMASPAIDPPKDIEHQVPYQFAPGAAVLDDRYTEDFGQIVVGREQNILVIPILAGAFGVSQLDGDGGTATINDLMLRFYPDSGSEADFYKLFGSVYHVAKYYDDLDHAQFELAPQNIGQVDGKITVYSRYWKVESAPIEIHGVFLDPTINKDIIELSGQNLAENGDRARVYAQYNEPAGQVLLNRRDYTGTDLADSHRKLRDMGTILAGSELAFRLDTDHFKWDPDILDMVTAVRKSTMDNNQIGIYAQYYGGRKAIDEIVIENINGRAYVIVRFKADFPYMDEQDFYIDLYLTHKGVKHEDTMVTIAGSVENDIVYVYGDDDMADISEGGLMVEAVGACKNVEIKIGAGLSIFANLIGGKRYYARGTDTRDAGDIEIMDYFPDIIKAYSITSQKNIPGDARVRINFVEYDEDGQEIDEKFQSVYYVYDSIGDLVGTSADYLPLRSKYYLAAKELNFDDGGFEVIYAGWADPTSNDNYNPGTGRLA